MNRTESFPKAATMHSKPDNHTAEIRQHCKGKTVPQRRKIIVKGRPSMNRCLIFKNQTTIYKNQTMILKNQTMISSFLLSVGKKT
ncbi:MAG: hypothetical protein IJT97_09920 [Bacteroidaceae bacterium]|nr:hypothetical protein [Bacteroidaceae bacterium]